MIITCAQTQSQHRLHQYLNAFHPVNWASVESCACLRSMYANYSYIILDAFYSFFAGFYLRKFLDELNAALLVRIHFVSIPWLS